MQNNETIISMIYARNVIFQKICFSTYLILHSEGQTLKYHLAKHMFEFRRTLIC